jgi:hypothetical protein
MSPSTKRILARQRPGYKITPQLVFDAAWNAFIVNNKQPAVDRLGGCCYKTPDGKKCAIGLCIPSGHPAQELIGDVFELGARYPELYNKQDKMILSRLQIDLHDSLITQGKWRRSRTYRKSVYIQFAKLHNLTIPSR